MPWVTLGFFDAVVMSAVSPLIAQVDALLPQTQCGLCGHADGCLPYAQAMVVQGEPTNRCVPGGQPVADQLAGLLDRPRLPVVPCDTPLQAGGRPLPLLAQIRESECIGCTKCLLACPTDAILGSAKRMHTVISTDCTGCGLCLPPCPVDCIDLQVQPAPDDQTRLQQQDHWRLLHQQHLARLARQPSGAMAQPILSVQRSVPRQSAESTIASPILAPSHTLSLAPLRSQLGRVQRQLQRDPDNAVLQAEHQQLQATLAELTAQTTRESS